MNDVRLYGRNELADKNDKKIFENCFAELVKGCGWLSSDVFRTFEDIELTPGNISFVQNHRNKCIYK